MFHAFRAFPFVLKKAWIEHFSDYKNDFKHTRFFLDSSLEKPRENFPYFPGFSFLKSLDPGRLSLVTGVS